MLIIFVGSSCVKLSHFRCNLFRFEHPFFGDNSGNEMCRGDIERRIPACNSRGSDALITNVGHFSIRTLFDNDLVPTGNLQINGCERCGNIKRYIVVFCHDCNLISANFVGGVSIGDDTVSSDYHTGNILYGRSIFVK